jgi:hemerythrin-like metal-binding protein
VARYLRSSFTSLDPQVDEDHKAMFKLLDRVATLRRESDLEELNPLLDCLIEHTLTHFTHEERIMEGCGYPQASGHAEEHAAIQKAFLDSLRKVAAGNLAVPTFIRLLKESFTFHLERDDMTFITWRKQRLKVPEAGRRAPAYP